MRSSDIMAYTGNGLPFTLRFPRVEKVRYDKGYKDCMTVSEFLEEVGRHHDKLKRTSKGDDSPGDIPRRTIIKGKISKPIGSRVLSAFKEVPGLIAKKGVLEGYEIVVLNCGPKHRKEIVEAFIVENGGKRVQNCLKTTNIALAENLDFKCKLVNENFGLPVLKIEW